MPSLQTARALFTGALIASFGGVQQSQADTIRIVIGGDFPLAKACFKNAADNLDTYEALEPCSRALEEERLTDLKRAIVYVNRRVISFNIGDYELAVSDFTAALDLQINVKAKTYTNRGFAYEAMGADNLARADYETALSINPDYFRASQRLEELEKPLYDRSAPPKRITVEAPKPHTPIS